MTKKEFWTETCMHHSRYRAELVAAEKKDIIMASMRTIICDEVVAVAKSFLETKADWRTYSLASVVRTMKKGQYTYDVFIGAVMYMEEPCDNGSYAIFDRKDRYDELADALADALDYYG